MTVQEIIQDIKNRNIKPIYFLYGDEPYFIDLISDFIEKNVLTDDEKGFNQTVFYGRDVTVDDIVNAAKRFPMMAERQVIIVKEAQELHRTIDQLDHYLKNIVPSTVLVFNYKYKSPDNRKSVFKKMAQVGELFESKPLYDNQVPTWINQYVKDKSYTIDTKASFMLVEFLGNDLTKIANELSKLFIILPQGKNILPEDIEQNIGISKEYNNFELRKAIGAKDIFKANQIINYFAHNPKQYSSLATLNLLFSFFTQLLQIHTLPNKTDKTAIASILKVHPFFAGEYVEAVKNYPMRKVSEIINYLRTADLEAKGVNARDREDKDLLKELLFKIMH